MIIISIDGVIGWDVDGRDIRRQLDAAGGAPVRVEVSSPGGYVYDGLEIFNRLRNYSGEVHTHIMSLAASMASYIVLAGDKITAEDNAVFMIHNVWGLSIGDHRDMRADADVFEGLTKLLSNAYSDKTGKSLADIRQLMDDETFLFGAEIKDAGFVDEITSGGNDNGDGRDGAISLAHGSMAGCQAKMKENEDRKEDRQKIAALLNVQTVPAPKGQDTLNSANQGGDNTQEDVMDLQKLKADHPALYAQVLQEGVAQGVKQGSENELARVKGHLTMAKSTGATDFAIECIGNGKMVDHQEVVAGYMSAAVNKKAIDDRNGDDPEGGLDNSEPGAAAAEGKLLEDVMALSKKSGAAVAPKQEG